MFSSARGSKTNCTTPSRGASWRWITGRERICTRRRGLNVRVAAKCVNRAEQCAFLSDDGPDRSALVHHHRAPGDRAFLGVVLGGTAEHPCATKLRRRRPKPVAAG